MPIRLRVKGPNGQSKTISNEEESLSSFLSRMGELFEVPRTMDLELLTGYPPQLCAAASTQMISDFLKCGDSITLREAVVSNPQSRKLPSTLADIRTGDFVNYRSQSGGVEEVEVLQCHPGFPAVPESYTAVVRRSLSPERIGRELNVEFMSKKLSLCSPETADISSPVDMPLPPPPEQSHIPSSSVWACGACTFEHTDAHPACQVCGTSRTTSPTSVISALRHRIPDDNSCLFHAFIFLLRRAESPQQLRNLMAATVQSDIQWSSALLGRHRDEYSKFIQDPSKWGGQVELNILSALGGVEVATVDIQTGRVDVYGEGKGYAMRVYMLFSGVHFDAITFTAPGGGVELRQVNTSDQAAEMSAGDLAASLRRDGAFTDQQTMQLVCQTCGFEMSGDYEARLHAGSSGHTDFKMKKSH